MAEEAALNFEDAIELGNFKVNLFPFREFDVIYSSSLVYSYCCQLGVVRHIPSWFPGADFKRTAARWRERLGIAISSPFDRVKADMVSSYSLTIMMTQPMTPVAERFLATLNRVSPPAVSKIDLLVSMMSTSSGHPDRFVSGVQHGCNKRQRSSPYICADVAAARTTMSTTATFLLAMILHPDIQAKAQAELDRETGGDRLPTLAE